MTTPAGRRTAPAVVGALADLTVAAIGVFAHHVHRQAANPGSKSWATIYLIGAEAGVGAVILLITVITAGRSQPAVTTAATLAWLRLLAVILVVILLVLDIGFTLPVDTSDAFIFVLAVADSLAGALICTVTASRTRRVTAIDTSDAARDGRSRSA